MWKELCVFVVVNVFLFLLESCLYVNFIEVKRYISVKFVMIFEV